MLRPNNIHSDKTDVSGIVKLLVQELQVDRMI